VYDASAGCFAVEIRLALLAKRHFAIFECKKSVVFADADVLSCEDLRSALANNNVAGLHLLACIALHAQVFWV